MKSKRIYYRRKDKSIVIEGKQDGKSVLIWTLPNPETLLLELIEKSSYFTREKTEKIKEKLERLDTKDKIEPTLAPKVPLIKIRRTTENDATGEKNDKEPTEEEIEKALQEAKAKSEIDLWEITK